MATEPKVKISRKDRIVFLMGPTGSGKSTFIDYATQQGGQKIGHEVQSCTPDIRAVRCNSPHDGKPVVFVDTPGFDDTFKDIEILSLIAGWFVKVYEEDIPISAIVYLHRISDNRTAGSPLKNLQMFASMCGQDTIPRVVIGTTMWSEVTDDVGACREKELETTLWKDMIEKGCNVVRFRDSQRSAWKGIGQLPAQSSVLLSREMVDDKKRPNETAAGIRLNAELQKLIADKRTAIRLLEEQAQKQDNPVLLAELQERKVELESKIDRVTSQLGQLKIPFGRKITSFFRKSRKSDIYVPPK